MLHAAFNFAKAKFLKTLDLLKLAPLMPESDSDALASKLPLTNDENCLNDRDEPFKAKKRKFPLISNSLLASD